MLVMSEVGPVLGSVRWKDTDKKIGDASIPLTLILLSYAVFYCHCFLISEEIHL